MVSHSSVKTWRENNKNSIYALTDFEKHFKREFLAFKLLTTVKICKMAVTLSKISLGEMLKFLEFYSAVLRNIIPLKIQSTYILKGFTAYKNACEMEEKVVRTK